MMILTNRKVGFLLLDVTWKMFFETGNIEAYLLLKELEIENDTEDKNNLYKEQASGVSMHMQ